MKKNVKMSITILVVIGAIAYLMFSGFSGVSVHVDLESLVQSPQENYAGKFVQTEGMVIEESAVFDSDNLELRFTITGLIDPNETLDVVYKGVMPDNFNEATQAMVGGKYIPGEPLVAETLQTKCPSKYEEAN